MTAKVTIEIKQDCEIGRLIVIGKVRSKWKCECKCGDVRNYSAKELQSRTQCPECYVTFGRHKKEKPTSKAKENPHKMTFRVETFRVEEGWNAGAERVGGIYLCCRCGWVATLFHDTPYSIMRIAKQHVKDVKAGRKQKYGCYPKA